LHSLAAQWISVFYIILMLTLLAAMLSLVRDCRSATTDSRFALPLSSKLKINGERIATMTSATLTTFSITKERIRFNKKNKNTHVRYPAKFDVLQFVKAMKDSLEQFDAHVVSTETVKERLTTVQIIQITL